MKILRKLIISLLTGTGFVAIATYIGTISAYAKSSIADPLSGDGNLYYINTPTPAVKISLFLIATLIAFITISAGERIKEISNKPDKATDNNTISTTIH